MRNKKRHFFFFFVHIFGTFDHFQWFCRTNVVPLHFEKSSNMAKIQHWIQKIKSESIFGNETVTKHFCMIYKSLKNMYNYFFQKCFLEILGNKRIFCRITIFFSSEFWSDFCYLRNMKVFFKELKLTFASLCDNVIQ